jgi:hypothetical protein
MRYWPPEAYSLDKKFKPCPVTRTCFRAKPFDAHIEGLSHYMAYLRLASAVQTPDRTRQEGDSSWVTIERI